MGSALRTSCYIHFFTFYFTFDFSFLLFIFTLNFHFDFNFPLLHCLIHFFSLFALHFYFLLFRLNELAGQITEGSVLTSCHIHLTNFASIPPFSVQGKGRHPYKKVAYFRALPKLANPPPPPNPQSLHSGFSGWSHREGLDKDLDIARRKDCYLGGEGCPSAPKPLLCLLDVF